jgi:hypothetical protein
MSNADIIELIEDADRQYEQYLELADLARLPGVLDGWGEEAIMQAAPIAPLGLTLEKR